MSQVCDCYGLTRKKIMDAVKTHGLDSADAVYQHFDATECGVCIDDVEKIVAQAQKEAEPA